MIEAALVLGGLVAGAGEKDVATLRRTGRHLGLAFQIIDDVLDATADSATLGKTAGKDAKSNKATYVKVHGVERSRAQAAQHSESARAALQGLPCAFLDALVASMAARAK
jgi:geranylgeranyl pyrophosphate synthase